MAPNPIGVIVTILLYSVLFAMYMETETPGGCGPNGDQTCLDGSPAAIEQPDGVLETILGVVDKIWTFVGYLFGALTFNVPGAPWFIRLIVGGIITASILWSVVTLARGN